MSRKSFDILALYKSDYYYYYYYVYEFLAVISLSRNTEEITDEFSRHSASGRT